MPERSGKWRSVYHRYRRWSRDAVDRLPSLLDLPDGEPLAKTGTLDEPIQSRAPGRAPNLVPKGLSGSFAVAERESPDSSKTPENKVFCRKMSRSVASGQSTKTKAAVGFEPDENAILSSENAVVASKRITASFPPDLGEVISAWPGLPSAMRCGILAIVRSAMGAALEGGDE